MSPFFWGGGASLGLPALTACDYFLVCFLIKYSSLKSNTEQREWERQRERERERVRDRERERRPPLWNKRHACWESPADYRVSVALWIFSRGIRHAFVKPASPSQQRISSFSLARAQLTEGGTWTSINEEKSQWKPINILTKAFCWY